MLCNDRYMNASGAAAALDVSLSTLYSYVSRGLLHSERIAGKPRIRRYMKEDVLRLIERKEFRSNPAKAAEKSLHWGSPTLQSALTLIDGGQLFYRGLDAIKLAEYSTLEEVAALLWTGNSGQAAGLFSHTRASLPQEIIDLFQRFPDLGPVEKCQLVLPLAANLDLSAYDLRPVAVAKTAAHILRIIFSVVIGFRANSPLDMAVTRAWMPKRQSAAGALRAALILCADHELNVSAFTARCIASARATPYGVVLGALAALRGSRHGGVSEALVTLFRDAERVRDCRHIVAMRLQSLGHIPGFGHPLYPKGDPRGAKLLSLAKTHGTAKEGELAKRLMQAAYSISGEHPNLDFGLTALARALRLPAEAPIAIFALGRTVGWIAHAIEQYADDRLIRPRARYIGPTPDDSLTTSSGWGEESTLMKTRN
jgi:citrate synthase